MIKKLSLVTKVSIYSCVSISILLQPVHKFLLYIAYNKQAFSILSFFQTRKTAKEYHVLIYDYLYSWEKKVLSFVYSQI